MSKPKKTEPTLTWSTVTLEVEQLKPFDKNPRTITADQMAKLRRSLKEDGYHQRLIVNQDNMVIGGHQRLKVMAEMGITKVEVLKPSRLLTDEEFKRINIRDNLQAGEWDMEALANFFNIEDLKDWGFPTDTLGLGVDEEEEQIYTRKIEPPVYEIKGEKPKLAELYDDTKTKALVKKVNEADIPDDIKDFLTKAAFRHCSFNYKHIAEYYAHAPAEVQELFEASALVIIDFNKAIELGFVKLTSEIADQFESEHDDQ